MLAAAVGGLAMLATVVGGAASLGATALLSLADRHGLVPTVAAPLLGLVLVTVVAWVATGAALGERFSDRRFAVAASPVRPLWIALDCPLPSVVLGERLAEHTARLTLTGAVLIGAATGVGRVSAMAVIALVIAAVALIAGEVWVQVAALSSAATEGHGRAALGLREVYWLALGVALGVPAGLGVAALGSDQRRWGVPELGIGIGDVVEERTLWLLVFLAAGVAVVALTVGLHRWSALRRVAADVPLAAFDDPQALTDRWVLGRWRRRDAPVGFVAFGTGSVHVHPLVQRTFCALLLIVAALTTARLVAGRPLLEVGGSLHQFGSLTAGGAATAAAGVAGLVTVVAVLSSGQEARLWHYRMLWEAGCSARSLWWGHLVGSLLQVAIVGALSVAWTSILLGRFFWEALFVSLVVPLSDYLAESVCARPTDVIGDRRSTSSAMGLLQMGLSIPSILLVVAGGAWVLLLPVHVVLLAVGGSLCFNERLTKLPLAPASQE